MPDLRCATGKSAEDTAPADVLVLFGAMGDLAHEKIFPALYHMVQHGHLNVPVIGVARAGRTNEHLKERVRDSICRPLCRLSQRAPIISHKFLYSLGCEFVCKVEALPR